MCSMDIALTRRQVREVDRIAIEEFGISGLVLMENAGHNAAKVILDELESGAGPAARSVVVFCGTGNNGGDGFVIARHLANKGVGVRIGLAGDVDRLTPDAAANHYICQAMGISVLAAADVEIGAEDVVVDALLGTGFAGRVREPLASLIERINQAKKRRVIAVDVPSGLDCDTGETANITVKADVTVTFVADKIGFQRSDAAGYVGRVCVADIGAPTSVVDRVARW
ncbi:MAG: NAD(P)H-hydrate epimerase [Phycisphaerae bacterium]